MVGTRNEYVIRYENHKIYKSYKHVRIDVEY